MKKFLKKNFIILLAFILPVLLIIGVALSTFIPSLFLSTDYNFIYVSCSEGTSYSYHCDDYLKKRYSVSNNQITLNPTPDTEKEYTTRIFLHNTDKNESREITLREAQELKVSGLITSPDGVTVSGEYENEPDFFIFDSGSSFGYFLTKGGKRKKLNLINNDRYYRRGNFQFIGWVLPGRD